MFLSSYETKKKFKKIKVSKFAIKYLGLFPLSQAWTYLCVNKTTISLHIGLKKRDLYSGLEKFISIGLIVNN